MLNETNETQPEWGFVQKGTGFVECLAHVGTPVGAISNAADPRPHVPSPGRLLYDPEAEISDHILAPRRALHIRISGNTSTLFGIEMQTM